MDGLDEPRTRAVLRRVVDASQSRHDEGNEKDQEVEDDDTIVGLDDVGYEPSSNSNFELQQLGLPPARAKSFAKRFDAALEIDRTEEIIYIDPTKRPRTLRRQELQEWFTHLSPVALVQVGVRDQSSSDQGEQQPEPEQQSGLPSTDRHTHWLDVKNPTESTMEILADLFDIHPLTVKDALLLRDGSHQKHEIFGHYHAISMSEAFYMPGSNVLQSVDIFLVVLQDVIISLHFDVSSSVEDVKQQIKHGSLVRRSDFVEASWLMYAILNSICEMFVDLVRQLLLEMRTLNELVLVLTAGEQSDFLRRIGIARDRVTFLRSQMLAKRDILRSLTLSGEPGASSKYASVASSGSNKMTRIKPDTKLFLRDVLHSVLKMMDEIENARETLANVNNTYLARVSIEVSEASNRMNHIMKKFNAMATVVLPLTLVTGLWGMNVPVPGQFGLPEGESPQLGWFFSIVIGLVIAGTISLFVFRRINWM